VAPAAADKGQWVGNSEGGEWPAAPVIRTAERGAWPAAPVIRTAAENRRGESLTYLLD